jgi:hypothetical protein|tara:strand:+ start:2492 stop:2659 length:168 start_codon:yes stop_codon:yes gene_type:complete
MTTACTDQTHPYYSQISKLRTENDVLRFLKEKKPREKKFFRLSHISLGETLDFTS